MHRHRGLQLGVLVLAAAALTPRPVAAQIVDGLRSRQPGAGEQVDPPAGDEEATQPISPSRRPLPARGSGGTASRSTVDSTWQTMGVLALLVAAVWFGGKLLKNRSGRADSAGPQAIEVLSRKSIDQRQSVHLVQLGSRVLLLGSSPAGLQTLTEVTDPVEVDLLTGLCRSNKPTHTVSMWPLFDRRPLDSEDDVQSGGDLSAAHQQPHDVVSSHRSQADGLQDHMAAAADSSHEGVHV